MTIVAAATLPPAASASHVAMPSTMPIWTMRLHQDEQADEEEDRGPLDLRNGVGVGARDEHERRRPEQRDRRRLDTEHAVEQEADDREPVTIRALTQQAGIGDHASLGLLQGRRAPLVRDLQRVAEREPMMAAKARKIRTTTGVRLNRKSLKVRPDAEPMMMFGGSPMSVAVPPMFDARTA